MWFAADNMATTTKNPSHVRHLPHSIHNFFDNPYGVGPNYFEWLTLYSIRYKPREKLSCY